jgi:hypothetical protein
MRPVFGRKPPGGPRDSGHVAFDPAPVGRLPLNRVRRADAGADPGGAVLASISQTWRAHGYAGLIQIERMIWNATGVVELCSIRPDNLVAPRKVEDFATAVAALEAMQLHEAAALVDEFVQIRLSIPEDLGEEAYNREFAALSRVMARWPEIEARTDYPAALTRFVERFYPWA